MKNGRLARGWAAAAALSVLLAGCSSDSPGAEGGTAGPTGGASESTQGSPGATDGTATAFAEPVDVVAGLGDFQAPPEDSGFEAAKPEQCPGATSEFFLSVFPEATPHLATSLLPEHQDAQDDEVFLQCRLSFEAELLGHDCTVLELRDVSFVPSAQGSISSHQGALTTTSTRTYYTGTAQQDGVVLEYTLEAGCDGRSDLSELENEFRAVWLANRDSFVATPAYQRP